MDNGRPDPPYDFEKDSIFPGYDPVDDGFAYPEPHDRCACIVIPPSPELISNSTTAAFIDSVAHICSFCFSRLRSES